MASEHEIKIISGENINIKRKFTEFLSKLRGKEG
jgi:hypothetical protein